jgi:tRNA1Val (adenine37-N6)-methyltransferase
MSRKKTFRFKQFSVDHDRCTMKVGTDGVLLGAWVNIEEASTILDIGTGSGVIALMMAQRAVVGAHVDAVELEHQDAQQALENVARSPWPSKISIHVTDIQDFYPPHHYELIVSNPPFFHNSYHSPDERRIEARHTTRLSHDGLLATVDRLLHSSGRFNTILPPTEGIKFQELARQKNLFCRRLYTFYTRREKPAERLLMEFRRNEGDVETGEIVLYDHALAWSDGYKDLTKDFYLYL